MGIGGWIVGALIAATTVSLDRLFVPAPPDFLSLLENEVLSETPDKDAPDANIEDAETDVPDDSESLSFFRRRRAMSPVAKWCRLYVTTSRGRGRVLLAIQRLHPRKRGDATWTVVDNARRVTTLNVNDRRRVALRRTTGIEWEEFAGLSREEKREAEEASRDLVLRASRPPVMGWLRRLSWLGTPLALTWSWSTFGGLGLAAMVAWRAARYFQVFSWAQSAYEMVTEVMDIISDTTEALERVEESWSRGDLELPLILIGTAVLGVWGLVVMLRRGGATPEPSPLDSDSGSEAGHSLPVSEDEKEGQTDELRDMIASLQGEVRALREEKQKQGRRRPPPTRGTDTEGPSSGISSAWEFAQGEQSESDSGMSAGPRVAPVSAATLGPTVDMLVQRLNEHEAAVRMDRAMAQRQGPIVEEIGAPPPGLAAASTAATAGSESSDAARLRESLRDPRERVLEQLQHVKPKVDWTMPANIVERVAPPLLAQIFSQHPSAVAMCQRWIQEKQLERNHVAHEMTLLCMVLDKSIMGNPDFVNSESGEILARRIYALKKAFEQVKCANDWRQPKGAASSKWKSKVRWDLANEIDMRALSGEVENLPGVDRELQARMRERALLSKYVDNAVTASGGVAEEQ